MFASTLFPVLLLAAQTFGQEWNGWSGADETVTTTVRSTVYTCPCDATTAQSWSIWDSPSSTQSKKAVTTSTKSKRYSTQSTSQFTYITTTTSTKGAESTTKTSSDSSTSTSLKLSTTSSTESTTLLATTSTTSPVLTTVTSTSVGTSTVSTTGSTSLSTTITTTSSSQTTTAFTTTISTTDASTTTTSSTLVATTTSAAPVVTDQAYIETALRHHNIHRSNHTAASLTWSSALSSLARQVAETCVFGGDSTVGGGGYGQLVEAGIPATEIGAVITERWYNAQVNNYASYYGGEPNFSDFANYGFFTQLVWSSTTTVGCYTQDCSASGLTDAPPGQAPFFTVCNYSPPGNIVGGFASNVLPPVGLSTIDASYGCASRTNCVDT